MNKNFKRFLATILSMVLVVSLCPKIPVQAKAKTATVSTQKELNTALKSPDIKEINIKTDENISLALKGDASQKTITANAANATISVKGNVGTLNLKAVNSVVLGSKAAVSTIKITSTVNFILNLKAGSTVDNLKIVGSDNANTSSSIKITNNGNIGNIRVNDENSQVSVVNNNSIGKILLGAPTDLTVSGKTDSVTPVTVKKTAAGSSLTLSTDAKISAYADVKLDLLKGAGNTSIIAQNEGINLDVSNNTKKDISIKDKASGFSTTVEKGATMSGEEIKNSVSSEVAKAEAEKLAAAKEKSIDELKALVGEGTSYELKKILEDAVSKVNAAATLDDVASATTNGKNAIQSQLDSEAKAEKAAEEAAQKAAEEAQKAAEEAAQKAAEEAARKAAEETRKAAEEAARKAAEEAQKAADDVKDLIDDIGTVSHTDECKEAIDKAQTAYNELSDAAKSLVSSDYVQKLSDAAAEYAELEAEEIKKAEEAQKAAKEVTDLIDAIGTVEYSEDSKAAIDAAQTAYDELTDLAKSYVSSDYVQKLSDAAAEYETQKNNRKEETTDTFNMNGTLLECSVVTQYADGRASVVEWSVTAEKMAATLTSNDQIVTADLVVSQMGGNPGPYLLERVTYTYHTENTWEKVEQRFMYSEDRMYYEIVRKFTGTTYDGTVDKLTYSEMKKYDVVTLELKESCVREETDIGYNTTWSISQKNSGSTQPKKIIIDEHYGTTYDPFKKTVKEYKYDSEDIEKIIVEECSKDDQYTTVVQTQMDGNGEKIGENTFIFDNNDYMYPYEPTETFITDIWKERYMKSFQNGCIVEENKYETVTYIDSNSHVPTLLIKNIYNDGKLNSSEETKWENYEYNGDWVADKTVILKTYRPDCKVYKEETRKYSKNGEGTSDSITITEYAYMDIGSDQLNRLHVFTIYICTDGTEESKKLLSKTTIEEYYGDTEQYKKVKLEESDYDNRTITTTEITYNENGSVESENVISVVPFP